MEPLNDQERIFAEEHEGVIHWYLNLRRLDYDTYYDAAVFGYLRAVKNYLTRPELRQYSFATIATWTMRSAIEHYMRYCGRLKRKAVVYCLDDAFDDGLTLNEKIGLPDPDVCAAMDNVNLLREIRAQVSDDEWDIFEKKAVGYQHKVIASERGISIPALQNRLYKLRQRIRPMFEEKYAQVA